MERKEVRDYLAEFQKGSLPPLVERELVIQSKTSLIQTIIGPRRAGKTYFLYQLMQGLERSKVLYLNFEDTRLLTVTFKDFLDVVNLHAELFGNEPEHIFLDEPQNISGWERGVRTLFDRRKYDIILTGSSSKLLGREIATQLRGRSIKHILLPYSFGEFLKSSQFDIPEVISEGEAARIKGLLKQWLQSGGYPEVVKSSESNERMKILESYKDLIIYRDIIDRYRIRAPFLIKLLIDLILANFAKEFSVNNLFNLLKSRNIKVSKKSLYAYLSYVEDSLAIFLLEKWSPQMKEQRLSPKKIYLCDNGLVFRQREELGRLMENTVFLQLKRMQNLNPLLEVYYWKDYQQREVDFILKEGGRITQLLQVTSAGSREEVREREVSNLVAASRLLKCRNLKVITWDYEKREKLNGKQLYFVPLWKWLLFINSGVHV